MSLNIVKFVKQLLPTLSKTDMESDLDLSIETLKVCVTSYEDLSATLSVTELKAPKNKELVASFYKEFALTKSDIKLSRTKNIATDILMLIKAAQANSEFIKSELDVLSNEVIVSKALTLAKSNVVRAVGHYFFITRYALDLANLIYTQEAENGGIELTKDAVPNKKQIDFVTSNMWTFVRVMAVYAQESSDFKRKVNDLSKSVVTDEQTDAVLSSFEYEKVDLFSNLPDGFIGSPIYSVRLLFAQWEADRYRQLKDKKKLLELRSLHLKIITEQGTGDVSAERELGYLQKRITDIDYKISKIEESARD